MAKVLVVDRILNRSKSYLRDRSVIDLCCDIDHFGVVCGELALESMERFIDYAEGHKLSRSIITATLSHDLYGCGKPCFSPRTSSY
jgi:hypothetical protein